MRYANKRGCGKVKIRKPKMTKALNVAKELAVNSEDKAQNKVLETLKKDVKALKQAPELKCWIFYDNFAYGTSYSATFTQTNPQTLLLNGPTRGTNSYTRIGDKIKVTSCRVNGTIYPAAAPGIGIDALCRLMIVKLKTPQGRNIQLSGSTMSATLGPPLFFNTVGNPLWPQQVYAQGVDTVPDALDFYDILYDKKVKLFNRVGTSYYNSGVVNQAVNPEINFDIKVKPNCVSDLSLGNAGTYADFTKNSIFFVAITETNTNLVLKLNSHCYFYDS